MGYINLMWPAIARSLDRQQPIPEDMNVQASSEARSMQPQPQGTKPALVEDPTHKKVFKDLTKQVRSIDDWKAITPIPSTSPLRLATMVPDE